MKKKLLNLIVPTAFAQGGVTQSGGSTGQTPGIQLSGGYDIVTKILCPTFDLIFWVLIAVSIIMILWAGYDYVTAGDDTEKTTRGRKTITWAAVGIAVILIAKGFPVLVGSIFGASGAMGALSACAGF